MKTKIALGVTAYLLINSYLIMYELKTDLKKTRDLARYMAGKLDEYDVPMTEFDKIVYQNLTV